LAKGKILLNRIDEFRNSSSPLQAFLYSDSEQPTRVYAVGSIVNIKGTANRQVTVHDEWATDCDIARSFDYNVPVK
ncbi:hypothetical protein ACW7EJ_07325, partial [Acinetobacter soli]